MGSRGSRSTIPTASENRPRAVVLGTRALCIAEPRIDSTGRPVYALNRYEFAPGSHKKVPVEHRTGPRRRGGTAGRIPTGRIFAAAQSDLGLSPHDAGQLGNLPPKAQELLHNFNSKDPVQRCEYWYRAPRTASTNTCSS